MDSKMNELIRQFVEQAGMVKILNEHASEYGDGTFENTPYPEMEKFAELIVKECANRATWAQDTNEADIGGEVLKHFGVEE